MHSDLVSELLSVRNNKDLSEFGEVTIRKWLTFNVTAPSFECLN
jgi:hypothetical protein